MKITVVGGALLPRESLKALLGLKGYRVTEAQTGEDALHVVRHAKPDLVVIDLSGLPDPAALVRELRKEPRREKLPLLLLGARDGEALKAALAEGADGFVPMPYDEDELVAKIHSILED